MSKKSAPPPAAVEAPPGFRAQLVRTTGAGRPRATPPGAKARNFRLTDQEYAAVRALVSRLRSGETPGNS